MSSDFGSGSVVSASNAVMFSVESMSFVQKKYMRDGYINKKLISLRAIFCEVQSDKPCATQEDSLVELPTTREDSSVKLSAQPIRCLPRFMKCLPPYLI